MAEGGLEEEGCQVREEKWSVRQWEREGGVRHPSPRKTERCTSAAAPWSQWLKFRTKDSQVN